MSENSNMICPSCGTFQRRAEVCNKCGVIIAKVSNTSNDVAEKEIAKSAKGKPFAVKLAVAIFIVASIMVFSLFPGADKDTAQESKDAMNPIDKVAAYNPAIANDIQRTNVLSKMHKLKTILHMYLTEESGPPSNEEGLQLLVSKGYLSQPDITDEWGSVFEYRLEWGEENAFEKKYTIFVHSKGPDGISGNSDDVGML